MEKISCFVIMPFSDTTITKSGKEITILSDEWTYIFEKWIKKSVESYSDNIVCKRSPLAPGNFIKGIIGDISDSKITIADLTGGKPNVYYELGIRHALKNGTIIISQNFNDLPSDLKAYYCFEYQYINEAYKYEEFYEKFEKNIHKSMKHILDHNFPADNPVSDYVVKTIDSNTLSNKVMGGKQIAQKISLDGDKIFVATQVKGSWGYKVISTKQVLFIQAKGAYTELHINTNDNVRELYLLSKSMNHALRELSSTHIVQIHRSIAVNSDKIEFISSRENFLVLEGNIKLMMSDSYKKGLIP